MNGSGCTTSCGCIPTVSLPVTSGSVGPAGPAGDSGGVVIYSDVSTDTITTTGGWQLLKSYNVDASQLATDGDELKISTHFEIGNVIDSSDLSEVHVTFGGNYIIGYKNYSPSQKVYGRIDISISRVGATSAINNIFFTATCTLYPDKTYGSPCQTYMTIHGPFSITVPYGSAGGVYIDVAGALNNTGVTNYVKCENLIVEYYKFTV